MSVEDFLSDKYQDEVSGGFTTIAKAKIITAFQGWANGQSKLFPYDGSKRAGDEAKQMCADYCEGERQYPQAGILTIVYGDEVPSHPEGTMNDWLDFVPVFHSREKYTGKVEVAGEFPYDLVVAGLEAHTEVFNNVVWCEMSRVIDNVREPKRNKETNQYPVRVYVVKRTFKSREEAYGAAGKSELAENDTDDFGDFGGESDGLSAYARQNQWTLSGLQEISQQIHDFISAAIKGENTPDGKSMTMQQARKFACDQYAIELGDLKLLKSEVPF
jgi:hypothetical protein